MYVCMYVCMYRIMACSHAIHTRCVVCAVASLIVVYEVVLVTLSNKKEFKRTFWREWLTIKQSLCLRICLNFNQ